MSHEHRLARVWQLTLGVGSVLLMLVVVAPLTLGYRIFGGLTDLLCIAPILGLLFWGGLREALTTRIITSPQGIDWISFGRRWSMPWAKVERVEVNAFRFVNLFFTESPIHNGPVRAFARFWGYDRKLELSPYIEDFSRSQLLRDIADYRPDDAVARQLLSFPSLPWYLRASTVGGYYLLASAALVPLVAVLDDVGVWLGQLGVPNTSMLQQMAGTSVMIGLLGGGFTLLSYPAFVSMLTKKHIELLARAYYLAPLIMLALGVLAAVAVGIVLAVLHLERGASFGGLIGVFTGCLATIGLVQLPVRLAARQRDEA